MYDLQMAMLAADSTLPKMSSVNGSTENAEKLFSYLSDFPYEKVEDFFLAYSSEGKADEVAVIALKNAADAAEAKQTLKKHTENRIKLYQQYEPSQVERVQKALIFTSGKYVGLIICNNSPAVKATFDKATAGVSS